MNLRMCMINLAVWSVLVMQSEQHVIYRLMGGGGGGGGHGGPSLKLTWNKLTKKDIHEWKLTTIDPQERSMNLEIRCEICYGCS